MKQDAILSLLTPMISNLLPAGAPPQAMALLMDQLHGQTNNDPPAASWPGLGSGPRSLRGLARSHGWRGPGQMDALRELLDRESEGNRFAQNPNSTAYGRWQFLDSTWDDVGGQKTSNRYLQDVYGLRYIDQRYGSPRAALRFHDREGWY